MATIRPGQIYQSTAGPPGASVVVTITPSAFNKTAYLTKVMITSNAPAALQSGLATISDGVWTLNFYFVETVSAGGALVLPFLDQPLVASDFNTAITVTVPAIGSGASVAVVAIGYEL